MPNLRKGHLVRLKGDARRHGRIVSASVNPPGEWGMVVVEWLPAGRLTQIHPSALELDDHVLRGRNVVAEAHVDDWLNDL